MSKTGILSPNKTSRGRLGSRVGSFSIPVMMPRAQAPSASLTVLLTVSRQLPQLQANTHTPHPSSLPCLFIGAKNPFPEAPKTLLTSHWPELGHMSLPKPETDKRGWGHRCASASQDLPTSGGQGRHGRGPSDVRWKTSLFRPKHPP